MRKLLTIWFFLPVICFGAHWTPCSGSGSCSITSMSGHTPGDTAYMTGGTYSSITINNMLGISFIPTSQVRSPSMSLSLDSACVFDGTQAGTAYGFYLTGSLTVAGRLMYDRFFNFEWSGASPAISISSNVSVYDNVNDYTKTFRYSSFVNSYFTGCTQIMQGTFALVTALQNVIDSVAFSGFSVVNDQSNGNLIQVNGYYRMLVEYMTRTGSTASGTTDVGIIQTVGNGTVRHCYRDNGYGYMWRGCFASLNGTAVASFYYDNIDIGHHRYGTFDVRSGTDFPGNNYLGISGLTGGAFYGLNNTSGDNLDTAASPYTSVLGIIGDFNGFGCHIHNNFSFNNTRYQANSTFQWNTTDAPDTANNFYQATANGWLKDSTTTWMPLANNTQLNGTGTNYSSYFTTDFNGIAWSPWGIGAVMYVGPSTASPYYFTTKRGYRKIFH